MAKRRTETNLPISKVTGGGISGAIAILLFYFFRDYVGHWPEEVKQAAIVVVTFIVSYIIKPGESDGIKHTRS